MIQAPPLVVDTGVIVNWFFEEPHSGKALLVLDQLKKGLYRPLAPEPIYAEFADRAFPYAAEDDRCRYVGMGPGSTGS